MNRSTSVYLDFVRFSAACIVFIVHANYERFTGGLPLLWRLSGLGNDAVMIFFVLSGYVMAYVVRHKERTVLEFAVNRAARLYSVVIPALFITVLLEILGTRVNPGAYSGEWYHSDFPIWRIISNLLFINELWFSSVRPFSNGPFWSLGYEAWYYLIFAAYTFAPTMKLRVSYVLLACLTAGPKIVLLMPVWSLGVLVYNFSASNHIDRASALIMLFASTVSYAGFHYMDGPEGLMELTQSFLSPGFIQDKLKWSSQFLSSYVVGILFSVHLLGILAILSKINRPSIYLERPIRYVAGYTFATYLFHYPVLQFLGAATQSAKLNSIRAVIVVGTTIVFVWALGSISEKRKENMRQWIMRAIINLRMPG